LKVSYESSERIRQQQKELILVLQKSNALVADSATISAAATPNVAPFQTPNRNSSNHNNNSYSTPRSLQSILNGSSSLELNQHDSSQLPM
jgi:hypothetical protein